MKIIHFAGYRRMTVFRIFILRIMKLAVAILILGLVHASAAINAQITLKEKNIPLQVALKTISQQSGYDFIYSDQVFEGTHPVTLNLKSATLETALVLCFKDQPLIYKIEDKTVMVRKKTTINSARVIPDVIPEILNHDVRVHVTDSLGMPLEGVSVHIKGTSFGGTTDNKGYCTLLSVSDDAVLIISFIGYESKELVVGIQNAISVSLSMNINSLDDIIVNKGYYTTTRALNTGNISVVKAKELENQPVSDPILALEGRVPGLQISQPSGIPGSQLKIQLRGRNSIANGNDPLYIVDGVPYASSSLTNTTLGNIVSLSSFNSLNLHDIEEITILKDADATAIYGSRGANGVILITTKKGRAGKTDVDFNIYHGVAQVPKMLNLMNTPQYLEMRRRAFTNDGISPGVTDYDINGTWDTTRYTNWQKYFIGNDANYWDGNISLSGGNAQTQFILSSSYHKETTVFPGDFNDRKNAFHAGLTHNSLNRKFTASFTLDYVYNHSFLPSRDLTISQVFLSPDAPNIYNPNGTLNWENSTWQNPLSDMLKTNKATTNNLLGNLSLNYNITSDLKLRTNLGYNNIEMNQTNITPFVAFDPIYAPNSSQYRSNAYSTTSLTSWIIEPQLNYNKRIGHSKLDFIFGSSFQENNSNSISNLANGFSNDEQIENIAAATNHYIGNYLINTYRYNAFFGRIGYNLKEKYILNLTARRDGSSRFGPGKQFGNFGAVGAGWIFSKEKWIESKLPFLNFGKLRASYGSTGNDQLGDYQYLSTYSAYPYPYQGIGGQYPTQLTNPDFRWEKVNKLEAGLELGFMNDRFNLQLSWYRNRTIDQLVGYSLPYITGFSNVQANLPAVVQNSGIELEVNTINLKKDRFGWVSSFNISFPRNKLVSYPNIEASSYAYQYVVGKPLFVSFRYHYTGIDPQTGHYTVQDRNKDGKISSPADYVPVYSNLEFSGGLNNEFTYKGFQLAIFFQFVKQKGLQFLSNSSMPGFMANQPVSVLNDNIPLIADFNNYLSFSQYGNSDGYYGDASYIRLKNVSLSWEMPDLWKKSIHLNNLRLYIQGQNLFMITGYKGYDPETAGAFGSGVANLPPLRVITVGLRTTL